MNIRAFRIAWNISSGIVIFVLLIVDHLVFFPFLLIHLADFVYLLRFPSFAYEVHLLTHLGSEGLLPVEE
jgi:hypothetical protein